jgi:hypothetical protein
VTNDDNFLSRWSRRKHAAARGEAAPEAGPDRPAAAGVPASAGIQSPVSAETKADVPLPPVESLTLESDFTPFMQEKVDPLLRRQALRTLFRDPRFNVQDGLDVYIADFSIPDPIPPEWLGKLNQMARLGDYKPPEAESAEPGKAADESASLQIQAENQGLVEGPEEPRSDTPDTGSPEPESKQS